MQSRFLLDYDMKRVITIIITLFLLCLIYEFSILIFVKKYNYNYEYVKNKETFKIKEQYNYVNKEHLYDITITDKDKNRYIYLINNNYHKDKEILEDILVYNDSGIKCIFPIFKDNVIDNLQCNIEGKTYSYDYLSQNNNKLLNKIKQNLIKDGYKLNSWKENIKSKKIDGTRTSLSYYTNFIPDYNVIVWNYKGVFSINEDKDYINEFLDFDVYDSKYLTLSSNKMYVMNADEQETTFDNIYAVNFSDGKQTIIDISEFSVSTNSYFNGVYKDNIYFMDSNNNTQYKINEKDKKLTISSKENKIKYFNGEKLEKKLVNNISNSNIKFNKNIVNKEITKLYKTKDIRLSNNHYYFRTSNGDIYMCLEDNYNKPILLFNLPKFEEWVVSNDSVFGISGNTLYAYNSRYGLKPIIVYNEFNYHTENIYGVIPK